MFVFVDDTDVVMAAFGKQLHWIDDEALLPGDTDAVRHDLTDETAIVATGHLDADLISVFLGPNSANFASVRSGARE